ncbi:MAG: hypothetical protein ACO1PB_13535 [Ramlibacter sp.]
MAAPLPRRFRLHHPDTLLLDALRAAPRRYRMPALPADAAAARAGGPETTLAFAIEAARQGAGTAAVQALFVEALAGLVRKALAPAGGDPAFQAEVLRAQSAEVAAYLRLAAREAADLRTVRGAVDALAHPGKLRKLPPGPARDALAQLHALAGRQAWPQLLAAAGGREPFQALVQPALERLQHADVLRQLPAVQRYLALCAQRGPLGGSEAATEHGRASARVGSDAEQVTLQAFRAIAALLEDSTRGAARYRAVGSLLTPRGFPGAADKAKDEWDAAIVRDGAGGAAEIVLLAEVKTSAAAATSDLGRLLRGLERLALAEPQAEYTFACADGELRIAGASLRRLQPQGQALPPHVIYCCAADEAQPAPLGAATRAVLLAEPASIAFAQRLLAGEAPPPDLLAPVWNDLGAQPRLRSALHQYPTAVATRAAMLHPDDLLAAVRRCIDAQKAPGPT